LTNPPSCQHYLESRKYSFRRGTFGEEERVKKPSYLQYTIEPQALTLFRFNILSQTEYLLIFLLAPTDIHVHVTDGTLKQTCTGHLRLSCRAMTKL
jgi:hypothetical protein